MCVGQDTVGKIPIFHLNLMISLRKMKPKKICLIYRLVPLSRQTFSVADHFENVELLNSTLKITMLSHKKRIIRWKRRFKIFRQVFDK